MEFRTYSAIFEIELALKELKGLMGIDIVSTIRGVSAGIDATKKLAELAGKSQNVELRKGILNLEEQLLNAKKALLDVERELAEKTEEIEKLKIENQKLRDPSSKLVFDSETGMYFESDDLSKSIPFCNGCYDKDGTRIRLSKKPGTAAVIGKYQCPVCKTFYQ